MFRKFCLLITSAAYIQIPETAFIIEANIMNPVQDWIHFVCNKITKIHQWMTKQMLSYDVASGSEITSCNKIDKPLVVYNFRETL